MNYNTAFVAAARIETAYNAAQDWIVSEAPIIEQRIKSAALIAAIATLKTTVLIFDWLIEQAAKLPEYRLQTQIAWVNFKRYWVQQAIKLAQLNERYQVSSRAADVWERRGAIARSVGDKVFQLD